MEKDDMKKRGGYRQGSGRKKGFSALEAEKAREFIAQKLSENLGPIVDIAIKQAMNGEHKAREWLTDRSYGKSQQYIEQRQHISISKILDEIEGHK